MLPLELVEVLLESLLCSFETFDSDALGLNFFLREFFLGFQFRLVQFLQQVDFCDCTSLAYL